MPHDITAVLLNWQRPWNLPKIVDSLRDFAGEIVCWDNSGTCPDIDGVRIFRSERNVCTYGRFLAAQHARYDVLFTQDDDVVVRNAEALYERFLTHQTHITAGLAPGHYRAEAHNKPWLQLGWGSLHRREWLDAATERWLDAYGPSELLHRKWDRIYTCLHGSEVGGHDPQPASFERLLGPDGKPSERDRNSLWLRGDHVRLTNEAVGKVMAIARRQTEALVH